MFFSNGAIVLFASMYCMRCIQLFVVFEKNAFFDFFVLLPCSVAVPRSAAGGAPPPSDPLNSFCAKRKARLRAHADPPITFALTMAAEHGDGPAAAPITPATRRSQAGQSQLAKRLAGVPRKISNDRQQAHVSA